MGFGRKEISRDHPELNRPGVARGPHGSRRCPGPYALFALKLSTLQDVVVMLSEAVGFVANALEQTQG
jgi:hypothetical protein